MMRLIECLLFGLLVVLLVVSIGKFYFWSFPLELLTHFQVQYLWILLITGLAIAIYWWQGQLRNRAILCLLLFTLALNLVEILPWYRATAMPAVARSSSLKVMSFNICVDNGDTNTIAQSIRSVDPDLVLVVEVMPAMMADLNRQLNTSFPYHFRSPGGGLGLFSKLPLNSAHGEKFAGSDATNLVATIAAPSQSASQSEGNSTPMIKIIGTHPLAPRNHKLFVDRNQQLAAIGNYLHDTQDSVILLGDFNLTPWSPYYRKLVRSIGLHNTRLGFGILPTWVRAAPSVTLPGWLVPALDIPIDHIFVSKDLQVVRTYTGDSGNSDHAPIISELSIEGIIKD